MGNIRIIMKECMKTAKLTAFRIEYAILSEVRNYQLIF